MLLTEGTCFCLFIIIISFCDFSNIIMISPYFLLGSLEECARYLETLKTYEHKPADNIQERTDNDYLSRVW
jgi:hypothetical protein